MIKKKNKIVIILTITTSLLVLIRSYMVYEYDLDEFIEYHEVLIADGFFKKMPKYKVKYGCVSSEKKALMLVKQILRSEIGYLKEINERPYTISISKDGDYYFVSSKLLYYGQIGGGYYSFIIRKKDGVVVWWEPK